MILITIRSNQVSLWLVIRCRLDILKGYLIGSGLNRIIRRRMRGRVESEPFQLLVLQSQHVNVRLLLLDNVILENFVRVDDRLPLYLVRTTVKFVLIILRV